MHAANGVVEFPDQMEFTIDSNGVERVAMACLDSENSCYAPGEREQIIGSGRINRVTLDNY